MSWLEKIREIFKNPDDDGTRCACVEDFWTGEILYECSLCKEKIKSKIIEE